MQHWLNVARLFRLLIFDPALGKVVAHRIYSVTLTLRLVGCVVYSKVMPQRGHWDLPCLLQLLTCVLTYSYACQIIVIFGIMKD